MLLGRLRLALKWRKWSSINAEIGIDISYTYWDLGHDRKGFDIKDATGLEDFNVGRDMEDRKRNVVLREIFSQITCSTSLLGIDDSKRYSSMIRMLQGIDREDLEALWRIVKAKYGDTRLENEFERVLYGDLKVMFEPDIKSDIWRMLQGYRVTIWKLIDSSGVHFVRRNLKIQKMNIKFRGGLLGLKRLHGFLEVTAAQVHNGNYAKCAAGGKITIV
ncbi:hypothetical protein Tco_0053152 [Tanacetum coccineum]